MLSKACPECGSKKLSHKTEGLVCRDCGLVIESTLMFSGEMLV